MRNLPVILTVLMLLAGLVPAQALNQVVNGSFEEGVVGFYRNPSNQPLPPPWNSWDARAPGHQFGNWNINVDGHDNVPPSSPPNGDHVASVCGGMNGTSGGIWQQVDVTPGLTFYLSGKFYAGSAWDASTQIVAQFWLFNSAPTFHPTSGDLITTGGVAALNYSGGRTPNWTSFQGGGLTAAGNSIYVVSRFQVLGTWAAYGMHMDDLQLHVGQSGNMVPEPGTLLGLSGLLGGLGVIARRRMIAG